MYCSFRGLVQLETGLT